MRIPFFIKAVFIFIIAALWTSMVALSILDYINTPDPVTRKVGKVPIIFEKYVDDYSPNQYVIVINGELTTVD